MHLPGISDPRRAVELIGHTARLEFCTACEDCDTESPLPPQGVRILSLRGRAPGFDERNASCVQLTSSGRDTGIFERLGADNDGRTWPSSWTAPCTLHPSSASA